MKIQRLKQACFVFCLAGCLASATAHATPRDIEVQVDAYSTGYFQNGVRRVSTSPGTTYCALSTVSTFINLVESKYCTLDRTSNNVYVLTAFAGQNAGVNCSMQCLSSKSFKPRP